MQRESFDHLANLHGIEFETTYDANCFEDQEYYGEPCLGTETATTVRLPSGRRFVRYDRISPKSGNSFTSQIFYERGKLVEPRQISRNPNRR